MSEMEKTLDRINDRQIRIAEEEISELEDIAVDTIQNETQIE